MENEKLRTALEYAQAGFSVFPVVPDGKRPLTRHGVKDASTDPEQLRRWWAQWPGANIGLACGAVSGDLCVVDLDCKNGADGMGALAKWESVYGRLPDTYTVGTPSGGKHLYFIHPGAKNAVNLLGGVDIRGNGGYVLIPPSEVNGRSYTVENGANFALGGEVLAALLNYDPLKSLPAQVHMPDAILEGSRNRTLFELACSLRDKGLSKESIAAALRSENMKCEPPLPDRELKVIVTSAMKYQPTHPYTEQDAPVIRKGLLELESVEDLNIRWIWEPYIQAGNITVLRGDPGVGKTYFVGALMSALAQPEQPAGMPGTIHRRGCRSVYFGSEDDPSTIKARVRAAGGGSGIFVYPDPVSFKELTELRGIIEQAQADLLIFDPIQGYIGRGVDMNSASDIRPVLEGLRALARDTGCGILIIEHQNKNAGQGLLYRGIGSMDITAAARSVLITLRDPDNEFTRLTFQIKTNARQGLPMKWSIEFDGNFVWRGTDHRSPDDLQRSQRAREKTKIKAGVQFVLEILQNHPAGWRGTASELIEACPELHEEIGISPKGLSCDLRDEDLLFFLRQDCQIAVEQTKAKGRTQFYIHKIPQAGEKWAKLGVFPS